MKRMDAVEVNRVFLLSIAVSQGMLYLLAYSGMRDTMMLQFLIEVFLALPGVYYLMAKKQPVRNLLGVSPLNKLQWLLLLPFAFCVETIGEFVNVLSQLFTPNVVGEHMLELILKYPFPVAFFVIALMPAVCEEFIFRGILYQGYRKYSVSGAIVLTAVLFGLMHMNMNQLSYAFVIGLLFAGINEVTGSVIPSVLLHLYINGKSAVLLYLTTNEPQIAEEQYSVAELLPELIPGVIVAVIGLVLIFCVLIKCRDAKKESAVMGGGIEAENEKKGIAAWGEMGSPALLWGVLICIYFMVEEGSARMLF